MGNKKTIIPTGPAYINGAIASFIVIIAPFIQNQELFWYFFATGTVTLLLEYMPMFPAFLKLRKMDSFVKIEFRVPGNWLMLHVIAYLPIIIIVVAVLCLVVPFGFDNETLSSVLPITICTGICILIGEIIVFKNKVCKMQEVCYGQKN